MTKTRHTSPITNLTGVGNGAFRIQLSMHQIKPAINARMMTTTMKPISSDLIWGAAVAIKIKVFMFLLDRLRELAEKVD